MKKSVVVAVSGGFDPIHIGHVHLFRDARKLGDKLIVRTSAKNFLNISAG